MTQPRNNLSYEEASYLFSYDPLSGELYRRSTGQKVGARQAKGRYLGVRIGGRRGPLYLIHRLAWLLHYGTWPKATIDHINGNGCDNRICNLREATMQENLRNRGRFRNNKLGVKGVCQSGKRFRAQLWRDGRFVLSSYHDTVEEAAAAYRAACIEHFGAFARPE